MEGCTRGVVVETRTSVRSGVEEGMICSGGEKWKTKVDCLYEKIDSLSVMCLDRIIRCDDGL